MSFPVDTNPAEHLTAYHRESSIHYLLDTHMAVVLQPTHVGSTIHPSTNTRVNLLKVVRSRGEPLKLTALRCGFERHCYIMTCVWLWQQRGCDCLAPPITPFRNRAPRCLQWAVVSPHSSHSHTCCTHRARPP